LVFVSYFDIRISDGEASMASSLHDWHAHGKRGHGTWLHNGGHMARTPYLAYQFYQLDAFTTVSNRASGIFHSFYRSYSTDAIRATDTTATANARTLYVTEGACRII
jgi:hypothetical protein